MIHSTIAIKDSDLITDDVIFSRNGTYHSHLFRFLGKREVEIYPFHGKLSKETDNNSLMVHESYC